MAIPKIKLDSLLFTHYQHVNLESAYKFFTDFGLHAVEKTDDIIYFRGFGDKPFIYVASKSPDDKKHFWGSGFLVREFQDLEAAARHPGASEIQESKAPGGGQFVDLKDLNGNIVRLMHGLTMRSAAEQSEELPKPVVMNSWEDKPRKGDFQRFDTGPSKVHKLGHYGIVVDRSKFDENVDWYLNTFTLARTDALFDEDSGKDMMTFMHIDKGDEFTDHHSFFVQSPPFPVVSSHAHHSSFETDNMDSQLMGHYYLESKGWTNCWGIGRHLLGSQIFDYWFDPSGNIVEHYSDGDLVNKENKPTREPSAPDTIAVWGPNVTVAFLTTRMEDLAKGAVPAGAH